MERKRAMAVAATATCVLGSSAVALAATIGAPVLGFGRSPAADAAEVATVWKAPTAQQARRVVTRTKDVVDTVVVDVSERAASSPMQSYGPTAAPAPTPSVRTARPHRRAASHRSAVRDDDSPPTTTRPQEAEPGEPPATSTSTPATTTTTWPRGVPADWPPDKPIPPMPPGCRQPQLEDNGVWNCQDD
jgi:hypothetical protein